MTEPLTSKPLASELRAIAETIDRNGGWHIAAVKVIAAADEIERLQREVRLQSEMAQIGAFAHESVCKQRDRLRAALEQVRDCGTETIDGQRIITMEAQIAIDALRGAGGNGRSLFRDTVSENDAQ